MKHIITLSLLLFTITSLSLQGMEIVPKFTQRSFSKKRHSGSLNLAFNEKACLSVLHNPHSGDDEILRIHQSLSNAISKAPIYRPLLFARLMLNTLINTECQKHQEDFFWHLINVDKEESYRQEKQNKIIAQIIATVKAAFNNEHLKQIKDRQLPHASQFPLYATDDFLTNLIRFRINSILYQ